MVYAQAQYCNAYFKANCRLTLNEKVRTGLAANVGRLMQELLKLSEETDIDALSKPTRALVINFPDELMPFACDISTKMVSCGRKTLLHYENVLRQSLHTARVLPPANWRNLGIARKTCSR